LCFVNKNIKKHTIKINLKIRLYPIKGLKNPYLSLKIRLFCVTWQVADLPTHAHPIHPVKSVKIKLLPSLNII
jgi:hypothetical protein